MLQGAAGAWCATFLATQPEGYEPTWAEFRQAFRGHYIPESVMKLKRREFESLRQGAHTVMEYVQEFNHLAQYAPDLVSTEAKKAERFLEGLDSTLQVYLEDSYATYNEAVNKASSKDGKMRASKAEEKKKKQASSPQQQGPSQRPRGAQYQPPRYVLRSVPAGSGFRAQQQYGGNRSPGTGHQAP